MIFELCQPSSPLLLLLFMLQILTQQMHWKYWGGGGWILFATLWHSNLRSKTFFIETERKNFIFRNLTELVFGREEICREPFVPMLKLLFTLPHQPPPPSYDILHAKFSLFSLLCLYSPGPTQPQDLKFANIQSTSALVNFTKPAEENGIVRNYTVRCTHVYI